jgi:hypothetical protein
MKKSVDIRNSIEVFRCDGVLIVRESPHFIGGNARQTRR